MSDLLGPQQVCIITSRANIEQFGKNITKDDVECIFWHMAVSKDELLYAIAVPNTKHIVKLIKKSGVFCVNFMAKELENKVHKCNLIHGEHLDKFMRLGFRRQEAKSIECPIVDNACAILECKVEETKEYEDYSMFIAKIVNSDIKSRCERLFHLRNNHYTTTKNI